MPHITFSKCKKKQTKQKDEFWNTSGLQNFGCGNRRCLGSITQPSDFKRGKYYKANSIFLSFLVQFWYSFFMLTCFFAQGEKRKPQVRLLGKLLVLFVFFLRIALIQHFLLYSEVSRSYQWQKKFNHNSVEMWVLCR